MVVWENNFYRVYILFGQYHIMRVEWYQEKYLSSLFLISDKILGP